MSPDGRSLRTQSAHQHTPKERLGIHRAHEAAREWQMDDFALGVTCPALGLRGENDSFSTSAHLERLPGPRARRRAAGTRSTSRTGRRRDSCRSSCARSSDIAVGRSVCAAAPSQSNGSQRRRAGTSTTLCRRVIIGPAKRSPCSRPASPRAPRWPSTPGHAKGAPPHVVEPHGLFVQHALVRARVRPRRSSATHVPHRPSLEAPVDAVRAASLGQRGAARARLRTDSED